MKKELLVFCVTTLCLIALPVRADLVEFNVSSAEMSYNNNWNGSTYNYTLTITNVLGGSLVSKTFDDSSSVPLDSVQSDPGKFTLTSTFSLNKSAGVWKVIGGSIDLKDKSGNERLRASLGYGGLAISYPTSTHHLTIPSDGLSPMALASSILVGGTPWKFQGSGSTGGADADGRADTITLTSPASPDGALISAEATVNSSSQWVSHHVGSWSVATLTSSLDNLFGYNQHPTGGFYWEVKAGTAEDIQINLPTGAAVPIPGAALLCLLGAGAMGVGLRRFA